MNGTFSRLHRRALTLPQKPGVYLFIGKSGKPVYVGRAVNLKQRVANYFQAGVEPRIAEMVQGAVRLRTIRTGTLLEAVILEANLIKKYQPKYNVREKDNRSFVYIVIPRAEYPRPIIVRGRELRVGSPAARVFGPYQSLSVVQQALKIIRGVFPYSTCTPRSGTPCFYYHLGLCPGACIGTITARDYRKNIRNIVLLLEGRRRALLKKLATENPEQARSLMHLQDVSLLTREDVAHGAERHFTRIEGYDISHLAGKETVGAMVAFEGGEPDSSQYRLFNVRGEGNNDIAALQEVLERRLRHSEWPSPDLMLIDGGQPQIRAVSALFRRLNVRIPFVGLSKLAGDALVFPARLPKNARELIRASRGTIVRVRDEAHRFANAASGRRRRNALRILL